MIKLTGLAKAYDGNQVLNGIDLEVKKGDIVVIIGPSGTGKSTLLRCLNLLETPDAGTLAIDDLELDLAHASEQQAIELRKRASFVFQNYALFANKTALDNIAEGLITVWKQPKAEARATALGILKDIGLADKQDAYPASLSGGQQQRVGIGRAMAAHSKVILFDEPTSALDPEWVDEVLGLMKELARQLRLRDVGGIVIVDLIDMEKDKNRQAVLAALKDAVKSDRMPVKIEGITRLGLLEMTRKRKGEQLRRALRTTCGVCSGSGELLCEEEIARRALRQARRMALAGQRGPFVICLAEKAAKVLAAMPQPENCPPVYALASGGYREKFSVIQPGEGEIPEQAAALQTNK